MISAVLIALRQILDHLAESNTCKSEYSKKLPYLYESSKILEGRHSGIDL